MLNEFKCPVSFELNKGESHRIRFGSASLYDIRLLSIKPYHEPFYIHGIWHQVLQKAEVAMELNGRPVTLVCSPYQMPVSVNGLNIMVDMVKGLEGGLIPTPLGKDARFSANSSLVPFYAENRFEFPLKAYRWRASSYINTWNGIVPVHSSNDIYYHRGEDFGAIPDRHDIGNMKMDFEL